jgi:hypothetical protein
MRISRANRTSAFFRKEREPSECTGLPMLIFPPSVLLYAG